MPRTRPAYAAEFKMEAVRLLRARARTPRQLAVELVPRPRTLDMKRLIVQAAMLRWVSRRAIRSARRSGWLR